MMRDFFLRFPNEGVWLELEVARDPGVLEIDVLGHICRIVTPPVMDEDGEIETPAVEMVSTSWRVNIRCMDDDRDLSELEPWQVFPSSPARIWA